MTFKTEDYNIINRCAEDIVQGLLFINIRRYLFVENGSGVLLSIKEMTKLWAIAEKHDFAGYKSVFTKTERKHFNSEIAEIKSISKDILNAVDTIEQNLSDNEYLKSNLEQHTLVLSQRLSELLEIYSVDNFYSPLLELVSLINEAMSEDQSLGVNKKGDLLYAIKQRVKLYRFEAIEEINSSYTAEGRDELCIYIKTLLSDIRRGSTSFPKEVHDYLDSDMSYKHRISVMDSLFKEMKENHPNYAISAIIQKNKKQWEVHSDFPANNDSADFAIVESLGLACVRSYADAKNITESYGLTVHLIQLIDEPDF